MYYGNNVELENKSLKVQNKFFFLLPIKLYVFSLCVYNHYVYHHLFI